MKTFNYTATIKMQSELHSTISGGDFPWATDLQMESRPFSDYNQCVSSCHALMSDVKTKAGVNSARKYTVSSEINPEHNNGVKTISKDWELGEVARIWVLDRKSVV